MAIPIIIKQRFCGPPNSGNGGYTAGLIASKLSFSPEITLRSPPPLEQTLQLSKHGEKAILLDDSKLIAEAKVTDLQLIVPEPISYESATQAKITPNVYQSSPCPSPSAE